MTDRLVCPECGNTEFTATLTTRTEVTFEAYGHGLIEVSEEVVDGGDVGDAEEFICEGCLTRYRHLNAETLTTEAAYERCADPPEDFWS